MTAESAADDSGDGLLHYRLSRPNAMNFQASHPRAPAKTTIPRALNCRACARFEFDARLPYSSLSIGGERAILPRWRRQQPHAAEDRSERREIDHKLKLRRFSGITQKCVKDAARDAVIGQHRGCVPNDIAQFGCNIGLFEKSDALRRHARRHEANQNAGHPKKMPRWDDRKARIGEAADPGAEQKPEQTA